MDEQFDMSGFEELEAPSARTPVKLAVPSPSHKGLGAFLDGMCESEQNVLTAVLGSNAKPFNAHTQKAQLKRSRATAKTDPIITRKRGLCLFVRSRDSYRDELTSRIQACVWAKKPSTQVLSRRSSGICGYGLESRIL